ncbi:hypothetical protein [Ligaoa zhengdingensis]|uniref:hypothetical protein n=1 Tax=Ligaoa zhengdingensis TaxID=2763658 RepID=UPI0031BAB12C
MKDEKHLGLIIDSETHYKLRYIAKYEGRSGNRQVLYFIREGIRSFEGEHGKIPYFAGQAE